MLVGRTLDGEVGVVEVKLRVGGFDVDADVDADADGDVSAAEVLFGFGTGVGFGFGGAGVVFGPSVKSPQSSNESSSQACGGGTGWTTVRAFFVAGFAGMVAVGCPAVNSPQSPKESSLSSQVGWGS